MTGHWPEGLSVQVGRDHQVPCLWSLWPYDWSSCLDIWCCVSRVSSGSTQNQQTSGN